MSFAGAIILAAGQGTRMKSSTPKVLHDLCGKPMVKHVVDVVSSLTDNIYLVIGHQGEDVKNYLENEGLSLNYVFQEQQYGTAHAVQMALDELPDEGKVLVLCADTPLLREESLEELFQMENKTAAFTLTAQVPDPTGYGRILRDKEGFVFSILEDRNTNAKQAKIKEVNTGTYCFNLQHLKKYITQIKPDPIKGEYYLTDIISLMVENNLVVKSLTLNDYRDGLGINDFSQLAEAAAIMRQRINHHLMLAGVNIIDPATTYIDFQAEVGVETVILPQTMITGNTKIGQGCRLGPATTVQNSRVEDGVTIKNSVIEESIIGKESNVGPYAYLRPGTEIGEGVKIGDFVEVKNSHVEEGTKIPHLSYIGDADIESGVNFGAGTIIVNYDGQNKHRTKVEEGAFIGCNSNLIAPIKVGRGSYIAAGSTVNQDVPEESLAFARCRQENKHGLAKRFLKKKK